MECLNKCDNHTRPWRALARQQVAGPEAVEEAGAVAAEEAGAVVVVEAGAAADIGDAEANGSQSAQLSLELPPLGVGDLGGRGCCCGAGTTTMFVRRKNPELAPWSLMW